MKGMYIFLVLMWPLVTLQQPTITSFVASDPDNLDCIWSDGDTLTIGFSENTNQPAVNDKAAVDTLLLFSEALGANYSAVWSDAQTLLLTSLSAAGSAVAVSSTTVAVLIGGGLENAVEDSGASTAVSAALAG